MKEIQSILFLLVLLLCSTSMEGQEVEDERDFSYISGSENGPERWGYLHEEWADCKNGKLQSPIDLVNPRVEVVPSAAQVVYFYHPANATIKNRGHDIEVKWEVGTSKIRINCTDYVLRQCHWHTPSEHTIHGKRYDMELHFVHQNPDPNAKDSIAVIALLYTIGKPDRFLSKIMHKIRLISESSEETEAGVVNPAEIMEGRGRRYLRYMGSLTTPPCTQGVIWTVDTKIGTVSKEQIELLREAVHDHAEKNARPLQPRNGRRIGLYKLRRSPFKRHG